MFSVFRSACWIFVADDQPDKANFGCDVANNSMLFSECAKTGSKGLHFDIVNPRFKKKGHTFCCRGDICNNQVIPYDAGNPNLV
jgi:hypothetical protein